MVLLALFIIVQIKVSVECNSCIKYVGHVEGFMLVRLMAAMGASLIDNLIKSKLVYKLNNCCLFNSFMSKHILKTQCLMLRYIRYCSMTY